MSYFNIIGLDCENIIMDYKNGMELYELEQKEKMKRIYDFVMLSLKLRNLQPNVNEDIIFQAWVGGWDSYAERHVISGDY